MLHKKKKYTVNEKSMFEIALGATRAVVWDLAPNKLIGD